MNYSKDEFTEIMMLADSIEDIVENGDLITGLVALTAVIARGGREVILKSKGEFVKQELLDMIIDKVEYWYDFYDHLDEVKRNSK